MSDLHSEVNKLDINERLFKEIKFFVSGEVDEQIIELLKNGGAERLNYFSDYVTHLIVGENPEENDIVDANDVYEIPAITPKWILISVALQKLVSTKPYLYAPTGKLFSNLVFCFSSIREDRNYLWALITYHGGKVQLNFNRTCNFLVTTETKGLKYERAEEIGPDFVKIVTPHWVVETVKESNLLDCSLFHPKLINWPKPIKYESTTAITGFEPEQHSVQEEIEEKVVSDSTQALLEKLKQRMPWNQPKVSPASMSSSSDPVAPPNVVAPSFMQKSQQQNQAQKMQPPVTSISQPQQQQQSTPQSPISTNFPQIPLSPTTSLSNQVPKSIIHHTPNQQQQQSFQQQLSQQQQQQQQHPLNINRLIGQPQARPNLQLRGGPLAQSQLHQQLLQQQQQQQSQGNIIQRGAAPQLSVSQQLLQQQLAQRQLAQRQLLNQNQLIQQQQIGSGQQQQLIQTQQQIATSQHLGQLTPQQIAQLQQQQLQLKQNKMQMVQNQHVQLNQNLQQLQLNQNQQQIQLNQTQQQLQLNQNQQHVQLNPNQQHVQLNSNQQQVQLNQNQQLHVTQNQQHLQLTQNQHVQISQSQPQLTLNQNQQQLQVTQNQQAIKLNQNQQQIQLNPNQTQLQLNQTQQQIQMSQAQQIQLNQNQQLPINTSQQLQLNQNQQQILMSQAQLQLNQNQQVPINTSQQLQLNQTQHQLQLNQNQHVLNPNQQLQLNQSQQMQLNQQINQNQLQQTPQQVQISSNLQQISLSQGQQTQGQQILQNQVIQSQNHSQQNQIIQQQNPQQLQLTQQQGLVQQNVNQHLLSQQNQQLLQQKQFLLTQHPTVTSQQQFVSSSFNQSQDMNQQTITQSNLNQQPNVNIQSLNQQLSTQNLGQQLNQQQLTQQLTHQQIPQAQQNLLTQQEQLNQLTQQQNQLGQQTQTNQLGQEVPINQQMSQQNQMAQQQLTQQNQLSQQQLNRNQVSQQQISESTLSQSALDQEIGQLNQQLNHQIQQQQLNRQNLQQQQQQQLGAQQIQVQQGLGQQNLQQQQLNQMNQQVVNPGLQQVVRTQFQQPNMGQQILINQTTPQNPNAQRPQISQQIWTQQPTQIAGQQIIRHPVNVIPQGAPRVQWSPTAQQGNAVPQRQFIQLDARTHQELQKMPPEQQAIFVAKIQRHRQFLKQVQQRGGGSHILIRGNVPPGLTTQQQVQWLQQQAKQQGIVLPPNIQQQNITPGTLTQPALAQNMPHAPGLSPINQNTATQFTDQNQQQIQLRQFRLQQLQLQREQAQKNHLAQQQSAIQQPPVVRPLGPAPLADSTTNLPHVQEANIPNPLVVNAKTKTALANMLSIKLQSGGSSVGVQRPEAIPEPSAAGTLRLMTAQHNAALNQKPQEIIAMQRRTIGGPNGEIIKAPGASPHPITPTNETPKLQYGTKPSLPLQHRPGPFYGHNPNLKLPPDLFLLGCVFVVVELEDFLEEKIPGWQQKIAKHGGEVEKQYCNRVTHVLCETQRHGVVMQALRDCKRCVTIIWLSDVMQRKQVLPPWTALHLPNIYLDTTPAAKHLISISGFEGNDRARVKQMIKYTGAKCTTYFSKHNTLLISAKADGKKCAYAKKWQIPVVNVQWLTDVMLGHFAAMNQLEHQIYQQFPSPPNFSFDPKLVPNLMVAWKAPINISQESYERVKRCASPTVAQKKLKKPKLEATDENDNINDQQMADCSYRILFSFITDVKEMKQKVKELGGCVAKDHHDFTHLVMSQLARTNKLFFAIAKEAQVVSDQWLRDSHEANQFLPESKYALHSKDFNFEYKCDIEQTLQVKNRGRLFEGKFFFVTPSVFPSKKILVELIQTCGGTVEKHRRSSSQIEATTINNPFSYFVITHEDDLHLVADLLKNKKDKMKIVCNAELIFTAVLKQTFEVEPYAVSVL